MKKVFFLSAIFFCFLGISLKAQTLSDSTKTHKGQGGKQKNKMASTTPAAQRAVQYSQELKTKLGLSDDQYAKILAVNTECITRKDALKTATDDATKKDGQSQIKTYRMAEFTKILTPDQLTKLKTMNAGNKQGGN